MIIGLRKALEMVDVRELRLMFAKYNQRSWYRLMADVNKLRLPAAKQPFDDIRRCISKMKPFLFTDYVQ